LLDVLRRPYEDQLAASGFPAPARLGAQPRRLLDVVLQLVSYYSSGARQQDPQIQGLQCHMEEIHG
jgi:hypothetical protein